MGFGVVGLHWGGGGGVPLGGQRWGLGWWDPIGVGVVGFHGVVGLHWVGDDGLWGGGTPLGWRMVGFGVVLMKHRRTHQRQAP